MLLKKIYSIFVLSAIVLLGSVTQAQAQSLTDINSKNTGFYNEIMYLLDKGVVQGFGDDTFRPDKVVSRAEAAIMIGRALGYNGELRNTVFPDVAKDSAGSGYIQAAYENNIIQGFPDGSFRPDETVTRGQMAIFIARAYDIQEEALVPFSDVSLNMATYRPIRQILAYGVTEGYKDGTYKPKQPLTRAQFSALLARAESDQFRLPVNTCDYDPKSRTNPDYQTVNCLITTAALKSESIVPPEIVKSIAAIESSSKQFTENGEPIITDDGGIGIMQITNTDGYDIERFKYDLTYNIEVGIDMLAYHYNRSDLPKIHDHNPMILESWYFAVMAYNGTKATNSPLYQDTGYNNFDAYQNKVFANLYEYGQFDAKVMFIPMTKEDFYYGEDTNYSIVFKKDHYPMYVDLFPSPSYLQYGDEVNYVGSGLRSIPNTKGALIPHNTAEPIKILGAPVYDTDPNAANQFFWYPAEIIRTGQKGYIASSYVRWE